MSKQDNATLLDGVTATQDNGTTWYDIHGSFIEGKGWDDTAEPYHRLPDHAKMKVRDDIWDLSCHTAGFLVRFSTNSTAISTRHTVLNTDLAMPHMPATGVSGLDLYMLNNGHWCWLGVVRPASSPQIVAQPAAGLPAQERSYMLYLPLYNGVTSLEIGVDAQATFTLLSPSTQPPVVYYGSSIAQGGCASRPGMAFTAILGRRLNRPMINLGFSGNALMEIEIAELLAELNPVMYVIDSVPNMTADLINERAETFIRYLRSARPTTPIVLVQERHQANELLLPDTVTARVAARKAFHNTFEKLLSEGMTDLYYVPGDHLIGDDFEATVDGSHPSDLGMVRYADALEPILRGLL
ncbi:MAG TPA: SGNH/GDSL hydrolase family protein [Armatimonadota bacterium]|nr:SGNH/GDSL hydrolase family protein [Armatimonadota bacterium]